uniref:EamA domain-containing protein n=1 Tax=Haptolina brevifila TaxID=156173 RepID=A0A7S2JS89_9EUKA|mmetsp:Transcript_9153/g.18595  ORF Transcript_9153/g.18595 Transcript_9153/m.18595 type:complete len:237 (+) Transcript_9153:516-1226(+)
MRCRMCTPARFGGVLLSIGSCVLARGLQVAMRPSLKKLTLSIVCMIAGASLPVQAAINARLTKHLGGAEVAGATVCLLGSALLATGLFVLNASGMMPFAPRASLWEIPPWEMAGGGLLGVSGIAVLFVGTALGMARYFVLQLSGQLLTSVAIEFALELGAEAALPRLPGEAVLLSLLRLGALGLMVCAAACVVCNEAPEPEANATMDKAAELDAAQSQTEYKLMKPEAKAVGAGRH